MRLGGDPMSPSAEALELLHESRRMHRARPIFTERRRARIFWRRWGWLIAFALVFAFHFLTRGPR